MFHTHQHFITEMAFSAITKSDSCFYREFKAISEGGFGEQVEHVLFADNEAALRIHSTTTYSFIHELTLSEVRTLHIALGTILRNQQDFLAAEPEHPDREKIEARMEEIDRLLQVYATAENLMEDALLRGINGKEQLRAAPEAE